VGERKKLFEGRQSANKSSPENGGVELSEQELNEKHKKDLEGRF